MYGHITPDGTVGQLFESKPPAGRFHPSFCDAIVPLPDEVTTGWKKDGAQWHRPRQPAANPLDGYTELWRIVTALSGAAEGS